MKLWRGYWGHVQDEQRRLRLSLLEKVLIVSLLLMCLISAVDSQLGRDNGGLKASEASASAVPSRQAWMALGPHQAK